MSHAVDSLLLAYRDGEIEGPALAELRDHLAGCAQCMHELEELRRLEEQLHDALALRDVPAPTARTRAAIAAARQPVAAVFTHFPSAGRSSWRLGASSLAKAALLVLTLGGVAFAIPGSPLRDVLRSWLTFFQKAEPTPEVTVPVEAPPTREAALMVEPANGRVEVTVTGSHDVAVTVRLTDNDKAEIETSSVEAPKLTTGSGRIVVSGLAGGNLTIGIPRAVRRATVQIDGQLYVVKQNGTLQLTGAAGDTSGDEVSFRIPQ
jgi:anti-sigma factor RsiW